MAQSVTVSNAEVSVYHINVPTEWTITNRCAKAALPKVLAATSGVTEANVSMHSENTWKDTTGDDELDTNVRTFDITFPSEISAASWESNLDAHA